MFLHLRFHLRLRLFVPPFLSFSAAHRTYAPKGNPTRAEPVTQGQSKEIAIDTRGERERERERELMGLSKMQSVSLFADKSLLILFTNRCENQRKQYYNGTLNHNVHLFLCAKSCFTLLYQVLHRNPDIVLILIIRLKIWNEHCDKSINSINVYITVSRNLFVFPVIWLTLDILCFFFSLFFFNRL